MPLLALRAGCEIALDALTSAVPVSHLSGSHPPPACFIVAAAASLREEWLKR